MERVGLSNNVLLSMIILMIGFTLSSDHPFQVYYKVRQVLLQSATILLQSATGHTATEITQNDELFTSTF